MRIAFLNLYSGVNNRGAEAFAHELGNRLQENHKIVFVQGGKRINKQKTIVRRVEGPTCQPESQLKKRSLKKILKYLFLDKANLAVLLFSIRALPEVIKGRFNVIVPMNGFWQVLVLKIFQPLARYRILVIGHSGPGWDERFNLYLKPNVFVATTDPAKNWAQKTCPWTKVKLIPYAVDSSQFKKAKPASIDLPKPLVLCPAALVPYKRVDLAIKAVKKLGDASLLVLGRGELQEKIIKMGKKLLGSRFFLTSVSHQEMASYYRACDLVTLPSSAQENSPMVFLESLAAGKRVVTSDTPRNRWMLENAGIYCDPLDTASYSRAIRTGLREKTTKDSKQEIKSALEKFKWKAVMEEYNKLLKVV